MVRLRILLLACILGGAFRLQTIVHDRRLGVRTKVQSQKVLVLHKGPCVRVFRFALIEDFELSQKSWACSILVRQQYYNNNSLIGMSVPLG